MMRLLNTLFLTAVLSVSLFAQKTVVQVESDFDGGNLNRAVQAAIDAGTLSDTIFELEPFGYYILNGTITVPAGEHLEIVGPPPGNTQETAPPQILWTAEGGVSTEIMFDCFGDITLKNLWIFSANVGGLQVATIGVMMQDNGDPDKPEVGYFENVIFDYSPCPPIAGGIVTVQSYRFRGTFIDCYFKNSIDEHLRYYGRALSFPYNTQDYHNEYVFFENCTFANIGYVYMQESNEWGDNVHFNHCTFLNTVMFTLQTGWWYKLSVTNSVFVNPFMYGYIPAAGNPGNGAVQIDSVSNFPFSVPFEEADRQILFTNSSYYLEDWLLDWMANSPTSREYRRQREDDMIPQPQPMMNENTLAFFDTTDADGNKIFPRMNRANLYNNTDPGFVLAPTNVDDIKLFLDAKWGTGGRFDWSWKPENSIMQLWPHEEDLSFTNETLMTASLGGFPIGDLNWWPEYKEQWEAQREDEWNRINTWLETGADPLDPGNGVSVGNEPDSGIPTDYALAQNFPNPFNPSTSIRFALPERADVVLEVYDILGRRVTTLINNQNMGAGRYTITWNGTNSMGQVVGNGMYFYRIEAGNFVETKRMMFIK